MKTCVMCQLDTINPNYDVYVYGEWCHNDEACLPPEENPVFRYSTPFDWLKQHSTWNTLLEFINSEIDHDTIQDYFQKEMDETGYFDPLSICAYCKKAIREVNFVEEIDDGIFVHVPCYDKMMLDKE
jgi:hypothetical protein